MTSANAARYPEIVEGVWKNTSIIILAYWKIFLFEYIRKDINILLRFQSTYLNFGIKKNKEKRNDNKLKMLKSIPANVFNDSM
jgi:hypothetical protein